LGREERKRREEVENDWDWEGKKIRRETKMSLEYK
jgi:hypothetical protein